MNEPTQAADVNPYEATVPQVAEVAAPPIPAGFEEQVKTLFAQGRSGAAWFYWVAALSLVNSLIALIGRSESGFALGLATTTLSDALAVIAVQQGADPRALGVAFAFDVVVVGMVAACGWLSQKRIIPIFAIGMVLYLLDGLLFLLIGGFVGVAIHGFALWGMWGGMMAYRQLNKLESQPQQAVVPIGTR